MAWLVLAVSLLVSFLVWHFAQEDDRKIEETEFNAKVHDVELHIQQRMQAYEQVLQGAAGLFAASQSVEREEWRAYISRLAIEKFYPGILGIGFAEHVLLSDRERHQQHIRKEGFPSYAIFPQGIRDEYTSIVYLEPFTGRNLRAFGYDMFSDSVRRAAMEQARDTGVATISGKVTLLHEPSKSPGGGFLLYLPIYRNGGPVTTVKQRHAALLGYVFSPFGMDELMAGILGREHHDLEIEIYDGAEVSPATVMYDSEPEHRESSRFSSKITLNIAGHPWVLVVNSLPYSVDGIAQYHPLIILGFGVAISLLLFVLFRNMVLSRAHALALAERMSEDYRESAEHYQKLFDEASDAIALADVKTGKIIDINLAMEQMTGWNKAELIGKSQKMLHPPEPEQASVSSSFAQHRHNKEGDLIETQLITKDGTILDVEIKASFLSISLNGQRALMGFFRDITERKQYKHSLFKSNELLECIFANIRTLIAYMDADFNFIRVNLAYAQTDEHPPDYYVGKNHFELFPNAKNEAIFREVVASGQPYTAYAKSFVYEHNQGRGVSYWDWSIQPVKNEQGEVVGLVMSLLNRTEEKRTEEMLRLYGRALDASVNSIAILDATRPKLPIIYVNPAFLSITGYSAEEAFGRNPRFLQGNDREQPELENIRIAVREKRSGQAVLRNYRKDGTLFWNELYVSPVWDENGEVTHFIGVARDITERKHAEHELEESRAQLRGLTARREETREEERKHIAREVHDELGQILTGLQLSVSVIAHKYAADSPSLREHLHETKILTDKALGVARDIASALRPAVLDMGIVAALEWLTNRFGSNTGIQCEVQIKDNEIQLEENHAVALFRIIQESLTNVARHAKADKVDITLDRDADDFILRIRDNGKGFDASAKNVDSFGLVGIRERVIMLNGTVSINSQLGSGTEIVVRMPINNNSRKS